LPAAQLEQAVPAVAENAPAEHAAQVAEVALEDCPAGHVRQAVAPVALW